ncbi:fimbria/pilus periplasmic chaperone [Caballeronia insecticola]|uniref:Fimbrial assembly chaperone n=1 Tax=Caballeronia insecticola TaxID=758793 RepID=R4WR50_9BURK|nr:fimbria/pilus periplasmic chaperone [Caballeronia insecticola]BAN23400.1 fimbrial assembly chaperone [Caballeronia insecticola]
MCIVLTLGLIPCIQARASVVIAGTRVIYPAGDSEVTLRLSNKGSTAGLVQVWVDRGEEHATPTAIDVPFTVAPPISRIDPGKAQTLRIFYTGETLPQDRESVFWLNVLEVPPEPGTSSPGQNYLQMSVLSRIKLFFRPKGLPGEAESSPGALSWSLKKGEAGWILEVRNDTAYHVSFAGIEVSSSGGHATFDEGGMVAPKSAENFVLHGALSPAADAKVHYRTINDYGGVVEGEAPVTVSANPLR